MPLTSAGDCASFPRIVSPPPRVTLALTTVLTEHHWTWAVSANCDRLGLVPLVLSPVGLGEIGLDDPWGFFRPAIMGLTSTLTHVLFMFSSNVLPQTAD